MNHESLRSALGTAVTLIFSGAEMARASDNPFALKDRGRGYLRLAEAGSTREEPGAPKAIHAQLRYGGSSVLEGKCGEGKCGSQRVRQMMDGGRSGRYLLARRNGALRVVTSARRSVATIDEGPGEGVPSHDSQRET